MRWCLQMQFAAPPGSYRSFIIVHSPHCRWFQDKINNAHSLTNNKCTPTEQYETAQTSTRATVHEHARTSGLFVTQCLWYKLKWIMATLCVSLYVLRVARRTFISLALCSHLSWKCKWPSFCQRISHHTDAVPKLVSQKKKGEMLLFVCMFPVIRACGLLFASSRATALIADRPAATETPVSYSLSCGCGPRGRLHPATGAPTEDPIVPSTYFELKTQGALKAYCEWANSLSSKEAKRVFINYLDPC